MAAAVFTPGSIDLGDGRRLAFSTAGPAGGMPVLYLHGAIGAPLQVSDQLAHAIDDLQLRWICVQRPGFGESDRHPERTMCDFADDVGELATALGLRRLRVIGVSAGGPYALACGHSLPGLVEAVAVCSSLSPLCAPYELPGLAPHVGLGLRALARAPHLGIWVLDRVAAVLRRHPEAVLRMLDVAQHVRGRRRCIDPGARADALGGLNAAASGGVRGLVEDYLVCCRPWGFDPATIAVDVHLWHGIQDRLVPHEHAWQLAASLPTCHAAFDPDEDHFFFRRRVGEIAAGLVGAPSRSATS